mmetsp:Transcript_9110/g.14426  ORF Transcript_9110/g.14426 Transcript_9110/m.14426 type:complete len:216 (+) Transcript_9110:14-661(+)
MQHTYMRRIEVLLFIPFYSRLVILNCMRFLFNIKTISAPSSARLLLSVHIRCQNNLYIARYRALHFSSFRFILFIFCMIAVVSSCQRQSRINNATITIITNTTPLLVLLRRPPLRQPPPNHRKQNTLKRIPQYPRLQPPPKQSPPSIHRQYQPNRFPVRRTARQIIPLATTRCCCPQTLLRSLDYPHKIRHGIAHDTRNKPHQCIPTRIPRNQSH